MGIRSVRFKDLELRAAHERLRDYSSRLQDIGRLRFPRQRGSQAHFPRLSFLAREVPLDLALKPPLAFPWLTVAP